MAFKTYKFAAFERQDETTYVASAHELRFLPAQKLHVSGFLDKPSKFVEFTLTEDKPEGWIYSTLRPKKDGEYHLIILRD